MRREGLLNGKRNYVSKLKSNGNGKSRSLEHKTISQLVKQNPRTLEVFDRYGIHFCAGCYITLNSELKKVAGYHAVPDADAFLRDLEKCLKQSS